MGGNNTKELQEQIESLREQQIYLTKFNEKLHALLPKEYRNYREDILREMEQERSKNKK